MQVDPINSTLKAPETKRLKLIYDEQLLKIAFKFNLRRYTKAEEELTVLKNLAKVGRCRLTLSNPC